MPTVKFPLVGSYNTRDFNTSNTLDQVFKNCLFRKVVNPSTNEATWYTEKRPGLDGAATIGSVAPSSATFTSPSLSGTTLNPGQVWFVANGNTNSIIYARSTSFGVSVACGTIDNGLVNGFTETILGGITYILFGAGSVPNFGTGWFLPSDAFSTQTGIPTFTGDTHTNTTIDNLSSIVGLYVGQKISGTNIQTGTRIATLGASSMTITIATTGTTAGVQITREAIAKIIDADFPVIVNSYDKATGAFAEMDGFAFTVTPAAAVYNSDLNSVSSWSASSFIVANISTDKAKGVFKYKNQIGVAGQNSWEFFYNAGNAAGSILSASTTLASKIGAPYGGCILLAGETIYFIGPDKCLWRFNGFTPEKIVAEGVKLGDDLVGGAGAAFDTMSACYIYGQLAIYVNTSSAQTKVSRMYFPELNILVNQSFTSDRCYFGGDFGTPVLVDDTNTAKSYFWGINSPAVFQDNAVPYTMSIQIQTDMGTTDRKFYKEIRFSADTQSSGNLAVSYSDNDGASFVTARNVSLTGQYKGLRRLGTSYGRRLWKFEDSGNNANRIRQVEIDYELGVG